MDAHAERYSKLATVAAAAALAVLTLAASGCSALKARDLLNKGVNAFQAGHYDVAIEDFKNARDLDPSLLNAQIYLAKAYATEYIPGAPSDENVRVGQKAIEEFKKVLETDRKNVTAMDNIAYILFQIAGTPFDPQKYAEAKEYSLKHIAVKPEDPEPYFRVGVVDWQLAYRANLAMRQKYNTENHLKQVKDSDPLPDQVRRDFTAQYGPMVDEGLQNLSKAISVRPDYADALTYQNLLLRQKADQSDNVARAALQKQAEGLLDKVKEIKQKAADSPNS